MESLMKYVERIHRCSKLFRNNRLVGTGLSGNQIPYILNVCRSPGISQEELSHRLYINKSNIARQLAILEQNGFVTRTACPTDKRVLEIFPTEKAEEVQPILRAILSEWNQYLLEPFEESEQKQLISILEKVTERAALYAEEDGLTEDFL